MTKLTEQWKKGELPDGWYWVEGCRAEGIYAYTAEYLNHMYRPKNSDRIIEQVPSYEEWKASENYIDYLKQCISVYESKDKQATETSIAYNELLEENTKLKELLKRIGKELNDCPTCVEGSWKAELVDKIDQVLANNKIQANTVACNKIQENEL